MPHKLKECYDYCNLIMAYNFFQFVHLAKVVICFLKAHGLHWKPSPPPLLRIFLWNFHKITKICQNSWSFFLCNVDLAMHFFLGEFFPFSFLKRKFVRKNMFLKCKMCFSSQNSTSFWKKIPKMNYWNWELRISVICQFHAFIYNVFQIGAIGPQFLPN